MCPLAVFSTVLMKLFPLFTQRPPMGTSRPGNGRHRGSATFRSTTRSSSSSTATPAKSSDHPERLTAASATTASVRSLCWCAVRCCNVQRKLYKVSRQLTEVGLFQLFREKVSSALWDKQLADVAIIIIIISLRSFVKILKYFHINVGPQPAQVFKSWNK